MNTKDVSLHEGIDVKDIWRYLFDSSKDNSGKYLKFTYFFYEFYTNCSVARI